MDFYEVNVDAIESDAAVGEYMPDDIEKAARLILEHGLAIPLILVGENIRTPKERYKVLHGHLAYYAALKAQELDPRRGETVRASVISSDIKEDVEAQIDLLAEKQAADTLPQPFDQIRTYLSQELGQLRRQVGDVTSLRVENEQLKDKLKNLEASLQRSNARLELAHTSLLRALNNPEQYETELAAALRLRQKLAGQGEETLFRIIDDARKSLPDERFESLKQLQDTVTGLGPSRILQLSENWERERQA